MYSDLGLDLENVKGIPSDGEKSEDGSNGWVRSVVEAKEQAFTRLQNELKEAHQELKLRDEEVGRLSRIRQDVEAELEDLTASLFQVSADNFLRLYELNKYMLLPLNDEFINTVIIMFIRGLFLK